MSLTFRLPVVAVVVFTLCPGGARLTSAADSKQLETSVQKSIDYLKSKGQSDNGSYSEAAGPAVTAIVTAGVLKHGRSADDPLVAKSLKYLEGFVQPDGGVYKPGSRHRNYETCIAIVCFAAANRDGRYDKLIAAADKFVKDLQWDEKEGKNQADVAFGGAGYGSKERPDLSNTSFLMDALQAAGNGPEDEAVKRALVFVSRCQNLETPANTTKFAAMNPDGGFYYTPAAGGNSQAGETANGGLRSYGSMTYAGLKSMIFAGVKSDDPRVKAAFAWAMKHYALDQNPGMGQAGLYYYYHTFAKALATLGEDEVTDAQGAKHNWRDELVAELVRRQQLDGSWINEESRWMEGDPNLVTGYVLLTLAHCKAK